MPKSESIDPQPLRLQLADVLTTPNQVSGWREHGKKYGYWGYFERQARIAELKRMLLIGNLHIDQVQKLQHRLNELRADGSLPGGEGEAE